MQKISLCDTRVRYAIWEAYEHRCFYSGIIINFNEMALDYIIPVNLKNNKNRLETILNELGLDEKFDLESIYNIVPITKKINCMKSCRGMSPFNTKLAIGKAVEKASRIMRVLVDDNKRTKQKDIIGDEENQSKDNLNRDNKKTIAQCYRDELATIMSGDDDAGRYHDFIFKVLQYIFDQSFRRPKKEVAINYERKRIDIVFDNAQYKGFFFDLKEFHAIKCPYIFAECKNYSNDPDNPEIDQLLGRFGKTKGEFGLLICRKVKNKTKLLNRCKDVVNDGKGYILVLEDYDVTKLITLREKEEYVCIDDYMRDKLDQILL